MYRSLRYRDFLRLFETIALSSMKLQTTNFQ